MVLDTMGSIPPYKTYFFGAFTQKLRNHPIVFDFSNPHVRRLATEEPDYFNVMKEFYREYLLRFWINGILPIEVYNQIISLAVFMPDIVTKLKEKEGSIEMMQFKVSQKFLAALSRKENSNVPMVYYTHLSFLFISDEIDMKIEKMRPEERNKHQPQYDCIKELAISSMIELFKYVKIIEEEMKDFKLNDVVNETDVFYNSKGMAHSVKFFNPEPQTIILLGNRGAGKTVGLLRILLSALRQGFTVIVFTDPRGEFRYFREPLKQLDDRYMWDKLHEQSGKPEGFDISFYTDDSNHKLDKDIRDFKGEVNDWESLSGINVFQGKDQVARLIRKFGKWRAITQKKDIVVALNEAQEFIGSEVDKEEWHLAHAGVKLITDIRGYRCPLIMNTQFLSRLKTQAHQFDTLFTSMITMESERKKIAKIFGRNEIKNILAPTKDGNILLKKHIFYKIEDGIYDQIKFLAVPCKMKGELT